MRTREEIGEIMSRIFETGGLTEDMEKDLRALKDELDEREGMLRKYGEAYDGENRESEDGLESAEEEEHPSDADEDWEGKYNEMLQKYDSLKERYKNSLFFPSDDETIIEPNEETTEEPDKYEGLTVEQLFN